MLTLPVSLLARIKGHIAESGPMPFESFMSLALYDPAYGFFSAGTLRSQRSGDFLTSPEVSTLFGETLAEHVRREKERIGEPFQVIEVGAGSGSLLAPLLKTIDVDAIAVEASPAARGALGKVIPLESVRFDLPQSMRGVVIANELVDNLPMSLAQKYRGSWRERWVGSGAAGLELVDAAARPEVIAWLESNAGDVDDGGWVEVQIAAEKWVSEVLERLGAGSLLVIDYGDTAEGLLPRRRDGTLRTYRSHHLGPHPLDQPGETDITADVNFTPLVGAAERHGARIELSRQEEFLSKLGLRDRLSDFRHAELAAASQGDEIERLRWRTIKTEAETLLHPRGLGDFRVLVASV